MTIADRYEMYSNAMFVLQNYGIDHQLKKTVEEVCELSEEIVKVITDDERASLHNLMEEIADVEVMLLQLRLFYEGFGELPNIEEIMAAKLERAVSRVPAPQIDIAELDPLSDESTEPVI